MVNEVTIGDIRGLLLNSDKRPVLRLLPEMDEVCRGYTLSHLGDAETIAIQAWVLNATDWIKLGDSPGYKLLLTLFDCGYSSELHNFALKAASESIKKRTELYGDKLKNAKELLRLKMEWIKGNVSDFELDNARGDYKRTTFGSLGQTSQAHWGVHSIIYWAAHRSPVRAACDVLYWNGVYMGDENKLNLLNLLADILEDSTGI